MATDHTSCNVTFTFRGYIIPEGNSHVAGSRNIEYDTWSMVRSDSEE